MGPTPSSLGSTALAARQTDLLSLYFRYMVAIKLLYIYLSPGSTALASIYSDILSL